MSDLPYFPEGTPTGGRPSALTKDVFERLMEALYTGNTRSAACLYAGISRTAFKEWMLRARRGRPTYTAFKAEVEKAEAAAVVRNVGIIQKAAGTTWQAAAWWLERKFPEQWSRDNVLIRQLERQIKRLEDQVVQSSLAQTPAGPAKLPAPPG